MRHSIASITRSSGAGLAAAVVIILLAAFLIYRPLLSPPDPAAAYPWSSDAWGHLAKAVYLDQQITQGNFYPDLFPAWYNGIQVLRYHAPLPYYLLAALLRLTGDIFQAGNLFIFLTALGGGLSLLLYRRTLGLIPAAAAGVLYLFLPDNLRVALAEGNLPRALANALLPLAFFLTLSLLAQGRRRREFIGLATCIALLTLTHAMMAAIFVAGLGLFTLCACTVGRVRPFLSGAAALLAMGAGLLLAGWWLLPSLSGGIAGLDQHSGSLAGLSYPLTQTLNPAQRGISQEAYYLGLSLVAGLVLAALCWKGLAPWLRALAVTAVATGLVSTTLLGGLYQALPLHQLLWPTRFAGLGGFAMLLVSVAAISWVLRQPAAGRYKIYRLGALALAAGLAVDFSLSLPLLRTIALPADVAQTAGRLAQLPGWRVATLDLSTLGSMPSYLFTDAAGREQVFGWAYQGSATATALASINQAVADGHAAYAVDRLGLMGADDVVVLRQAGFSSRIARALEDAGYQEDAPEAQGRVALYHRDGRPRAYALPNQILGIGRGAPSLALLFPAVVTGASDYLDDYPQEFLDRFDRLYLAGFRWRDRGAAEGRVREFLEHGGQTVLVDLTGVPPEVLSQRPRFLGVYGEPVLGLTHADLVVEGKRSPLLPFRPDLLPWHSMAPQGLDQTLAGFSYPAASGAALGVKQLEGVAGPGVHFIGLNLVYHGLLTRDPAVTRMLEGLLGMAQGQMPPRQAIPITDYQAQEWGYRFSYQTSQATLAVIPVASHPGTRLSVDGLPVPHRSIERLVAAELPAGGHQVEIRLEATPVYRLGILASVLGVALILIWAMGPAALSAARRIWGLSRPGHIGLATPWGWSWARHRRASLCLAALAAGAAVAATVPPGVAADSQSMRGAGNQPNSAVSLITWSPVMDGAFADWEGLPHLTDPAGDAGHWSGDLEALYWASPEDGAAVYWMVQRYPHAAATDGDDSTSEDEGGGGAGEANNDDDDDESDESALAVYTIHVDTNDDGVFNSAGDRKVVVRYQPRQHSAEVQVRVTAGNSSSTLAVFSGDWGESLADGGRRVELRVPWSNLGISFGQEVRMYATSSRGDRVPNSGDVQWSSASVLGYAGLALVLLAGAALLWRARRDREATCPSGR